MAFLQWFLTPTGRICAAVLLMMLVQLLKRWPLFADALAHSPRLRMLWVAILAASPAALLFAGGAEVSAVAETAATAFLGAMGLKAGWTALRTSPGAVLAEAAQKLEAADAAANDSEASK